MKKYTLNGSLTYIRNQNIAKYFIPRSSIIGLHYMKIPDAKHAFEHLLDWIMADIIDVIPL